MKFVYICEVCSKEFDNYEECAAHEKTCREEHEKGLSAERQLKYNLSEAVENDIDIVVAIPKIVGTELVDEYYQIDDVAYNCNKKRIEIELNFDKKAEEQKI